MYVQLYVSLLPKGVYFVILKVDIFFRVSLGFRIMIVMKEADWKG